MVALEYCRIYTQHTFKGKGAPAVSAEAFLVELGTQLVDTQSFGVHLKNGDELNKEGTGTDKGHFDIASLA